MSSSNPLPNRPKTSAEWFLGLLLQPGFSFLPALVIGGVFWASAPDNGAYGFMHPTQVQLPSLLFFIGFYVAAILAATLGSMLGRRIGTRLQHIGNGPTAFQNAYYVFTAIAASGVLLAWLKVLSVAPNVIRDLAELNGNAMKIALTEDYSVVYSLRYAAGPAAGVALFHRLSLRPKARMTRLCDWINLVAVLLGAALSQRMLITQACFVAVGCHLLALPERRISWKSMLIPAGCILVIATAMTYVRNANFYADRYNVKTPAGVMQVQIARYLAAPMQVSLSVSRFAAYRDSDAAHHSNMKYLLLPTFLHDESRKTDFSGGVGEQWYLGFTDVDKTLTTNSALAEIYQDAQGNTFLFACIAFFLFAVIATGLIQLKMFVSVAGLMLLYSFAEIWREYQFNNGLVYFQLVAILAATVIGIAISNLQTIKLRRYQTR
ncbi:hypothetical protein [Novipirellula caenicola]|uniref:Oligosaccharide repeat unit polymerase n=1 Tax=Novipirellula caenicola TaxID=1536901 RepID=A0ABP9VJQ2_9BACT